MKYILWISILAPFIKATQVEPDLYERMMQQRDLHEAATKMLGKAIMHIKSKDASCKVLPELEKFHADSVQKLKEEMPAPIEYTGGH